VRRFREVREMEKGRGKKREVAKEEGGEKGRANGEGKASGQKKALRVSGARGVKRYGNRERRSGIAEVRRWAVEHAGPDLGASRCCRGSSASRSPG